MKKLIFIGAFALISMAACQNETSNPDEIQKIKVEQASKSALNLVKKQAAVSNKSDVTDEPIGPNDAVIDCHTDYINPFGSACVWSGGYLFKVEWWTRTQPGGQPSVKEYSSTKVSFCTCG